MNEDADAAALRLAFNRAIADYPKRPDGSPVWGFNDDMRNWWASFYAAVVNSQAGLSLLAELETLREKVRLLEGRQ